MELVEGETLADRIARGPTPLDEALDIARQIIAALEAAHGQGIVHRDLKPANSNAPGRNGEGARLRPRESAPSRIAEVSEQITQAVVSSPGIVLGTPAYMAPEQARGETVGHAADVWAFGWVFFELLSGKPPFQGKTTTEVLSEVLKAEPEWDALPHSTPPAIRRVLRRCLAKEVRSRFHDVADVRLAIDDATEMSDTGRFRPTVPDGASMPRGPPRYWRLPLRGCSSRDNRQPRFNDASIS